MSNHDSDDSKNQKPKTPLTPFGGWNTPQEGGPQPVVSQPDGSQATPSQDDVFKGQKKKVDYSKIRSFSATFGVVNNSIEKLDEALNEAEENSEETETQQPQSADPQRPQLQDDDPFAFNPDELPPEAQPRKLEALKADTLKTAMANHDQLAAGFTFASGSVVGTASIVEVMEEAAPPVGDFNNPFANEPEKEEASVSSSWNFSTEDSTLSPSPQEPKGLLAEIEEEVSPPISEEDMLFNPFKVALKDAEVTPIIRDEEATASTPDTPPSSTGSDENDPFMLPDFVKKEAKKTKHTSFPAATDTEMQNSENENTPAPKQEKSEPVAEKTADAPDVSDPFALPAEDASAPLPDITHSAEQTAPAADSAENSALFNPFAQTPEEKPASVTTEPSEPEESAETSSIAPEAEKTEETTQPVSKEDDIPQPLFESGEEVGQDRLLVNSDAQEVTFNPLTAPAADPFSISDFTEEANAPAAEHTPYIHKSPSAQEPEQPQGHDSYGEAPEPLHDTKEESAFIPIHTEADDDTMPAPASHSDAEVETILALHMEWLQSRGKQGRRANFRNASLEQYDFSQQNLSEASFRGANLNGASFAGASLQGADLSEASLVGVNFNGADMSNIMAMRADFRHSALENSCLINADFTGASLSGANLRHLDMSAVTLMEADLHNADLQGSLLRGSNLRAANFAYANLHEVNLSEANCRDVVFNHARITFANVEGANFKSARLEEVDFKGTDITRAEELDPEYTQETMQAGMEQLNEEWGKLEQKSSELDQTRHSLETERNRLNAEKQQLMEELEATRREKHDLETFVQNVDEAFKRHKKSIKKLKVFTVLWGFITLLVGTGILLLINALNLNTLDWIELSVVFGFSVFILGLFISTTLRCLAITSNFRKLRELMQQRVTDSH